MQIGSSFLPERRNQLVKHEVSPVPHVFRELALEI